MKYFAWWVASVAFVKVSMAFLVLAFAFTVLTSDKANIGINWHFSNEVQVDGE